MDFKFLFEKFFCGVDKDDFFVLLSFVLIGDCGCCVGVGDFRGFG